MNPTLRLARGFMAGQPSASCASALAPGARRGRNERNREHWSTSGPGSALCKELSKRLGGGGGIVTSATLPRHRKCL